jgi:hypothetical protein
MESFSRPSLVLLGAYTYFYAIFKEGKSCGSYEDGNI